MSDPVLVDSHDSLPPPPPPLPPGRLGQLQRIIAPWGKHAGAKLHGGGPAQGERDHTLRQITGIHTYSPLPSQTATHRTGIPIAAVDINAAGTHAVLAGKEILKTVRVRDGKVTEDLNIRASVGSYASTYSSPQLDGADKHREYLPARDVRWSTGQYDHIIATAATNGRIALYDLKAPGPKTVLARLHEHTGQINKLDFDPFAGYLLLSASQDKSVRLWDLREPKPDKARLRFEVRSPVRDVRWSPADPLDFAVCADGGVIQKWDARAPQLPKLSISGHEKACYSIDYHPDGRHVISGGFDKFIRVWDFQSDKKRQKPVFQLRAPHAIRNIRWRPAAQASEATESGHWSSTQVAVSYYHDDPRVHIWDLRRPHLPFRELDRYNNPPNDLLWANKDMLWTVGDEGIFSQWDVKHATPLYNQLAPSTGQFMPDGQYYIFSEDRELRRPSAQDDPAVGFLSVPQEKLSSGDDGAASRSLTDDEGGLESTVGSTFRRRERAVISSRSNKSYTNSPPSMDDKPPILSLDKAVFDRHDLFNNNQVGSAGYIPGVAAEPEVVEFLAFHYATPATVDDRTSSPDTILQRLQDAFNQNAAACDSVSMHRMAQSWRILGAVIVPELKDWADANRSRRRADAARRREALESFRSGTHRPGLSPLAGLPGRGGNAKQDGKSRPLMTSLFKGIVDVERTNEGPDVESTSNMTTPLVKPLPASPMSGNRRWSQISGEEGIDSMVPLPPSVLSSHSTAAVAARALIDSPDRVTRSNPPSPDLLRSKATESTKDLLSVTRSPLQSASRPKPDLLAQRPGPTKSHNQEDRRTAIRDYRMPTRTVFTLDESTNKLTKSPASPSGGQNEFGESFPMFSASTDSSQKAPSLGESFESPGATGSASGGHEGEETEDDPDDESEASSSGGLDGKKPTLPQRAAAEPLLDPGDTTRKLPAPKNTSSWQADQEHGFALNSQPEMVVGSSPDIFHFEDGPSIRKPRILTSNPILLEHATEPSGQNAEHGTAGSSHRIPMDELDCETYLYQDFRPIDLSHYELKLPFAWSSLPLICQSICFDVENGIGHGQFATHLLMHVHPYFFHPSFRQLKRAEKNEEVDSLSDRLMTPDLGHRVIESIFQNHLTFLRQMGLFESAAFLRKVCVEFEYAKIYSPAEASKQEGGSLSNGDSMTVSVVCSHCQGPMPAGRGVCERCRRARSVCPICQSSSDEGDWQDAHSPRPWGQNKNQWMYCQACGHSGHARCLTQWFVQLDSEGTCPTRGCGCHCGPGVTRQHRVERQATREEEAKLIRGSASGVNNAGSSTKRDPLRATPSPAVDKVRLALRNSVGGERATQSGDERDTTGRRASSRGRMPGFSSRKSVRLITPGEEEEASPSRS